MRKLPKILFLFAAVLIVTGSCKKDQQVYFFTSFHEPADQGLRMLFSYDGYHWKDLDTILLKPAVGNQEVMRDPSITRGPDGVFHLVWTSSWQGDPGFGYASSKDLKTWSEQKFIPVMEFDTSTVNVWAPEIYYEDETAEFIITWASTIPYKFEKGIEDERNNHRMYYTVTKDFDTFSDTKLFLDPGFSVIDAVIVKRKKNDYILVLKDNTRPNRNLKVAFSSSPLGPWNNISEAFTGKLTEGPTVVKPGADWLIYYDSYGDKKYRAVKTKDFIHFEDADAEISIPEGHKHGTIFTADRSILDGLPGTVEKDAEAGDSVFYSGTTLVNIDYHHGQLPLARGVHNIQVMRANREYPASADGFGWTYNHAPNLAWWNDRFYLQYLSDETGEHIPPSRTLLVTSTDGYNWSKPFVVFPPYRIPDGTTKEGTEGISKDLYAVMHQRMGFYVTTDNRLMVLGYYGICMHPKDSPNDGKGIGRVIREVYVDGTMGPVYFIHYNKKWNAAGTSFPFYTESDDKGFVAACDQILSEPLILQQWNEESDRDDPLIPQNKEYKAFCYYHLPDGRIVGLWKHALYEISGNNGQTWNHVRRAPGFVTKNAKIWGQKTSDNRYATVYNPSEFRWPLAVSVSDDGLEYRNLLLVNGEITTMRYGGNYKSYGPQYVRGITENNVRPPGGDLWVTYSMNKEDIWISKIPVPISSGENSRVNEVFNEMEQGTELDSWNIFSPAWAPVMIGEMDGKRYLVLRDRDPFDYAKAERLVPESQKMTAEFTIIPAQNDHGLLHIEFQDAKGTAAIRLVFDQDKKISVKDGYRLSGVSSYDAGKEYDIKVELDAYTRLYDVYVNGEKKTTRMFFAPVHSIERICFRTGGVRRFPDPDTPTDQDFDVPGAGRQDLEAVFYLESLKTYHPGE